MTRLPIEEISSTLILEILTEISAEYLDSLKYYRIIWKFGLELCIFRKIFLPLLLRMRNISEGLSRENLCAHFILNISFHKIVPFMKKMLEYCA